MITIIGRGHSGTRAISQTLSESGVFMGSPLNASGDLLPPEKMYEACRIYARHVRWRGSLKWDWNGPLSMDIPSEFVELVNSYLESVLASTAEHKGWKIPETTLVFPWIARMFPNTKYIFWIRNPRDCILRGHLTDDLGRFGIPYPATDDERRRRAISWRYQYDLVKATPKPKNWLEVRFENFVQRQEETLARLERFLGIRLARIPTRPESVDRWRQNKGTSYYDFLGPAMLEHSYEIPVNEKDGDLEAPR